MKSETATTGPGAPSSARVTNGTGGSLPGFSSASCSQVDRVAAQLVPGRHRPHVRLDAPFLGEQPLCIERPRHRHPGREELRLRPTVRVRRGGQPVDAAQQGVDVEVGRLLRLDDRLVVDRDVVEDVPVADLRRLERADAVHPRQARADDVRDLVRERRVVGDARRVGRREQVRVPVGVLQPLAGERGAAGGRAQHEAATELVGELPELVARPLEAEHRVEDVERDHRRGVRRVRRPRRDEGRHRAGLGDPLVQDLAGRRFLVRQQEPAVDRLVLLPVRRVDLRGREDRVETEGAGLVRNDRDEARPDLLVLHEVLEQPDGRHRRRDLLLARSGPQLLVRLVAGLA